MTFGAVERWSAKTKGKSREVSSLQVGAEDPVGDSGRALPPTGGAPACAILVPCESAALE